MPLDSLSIGANVKGSKQQLLTRSCVVVIAVLSLIVVISCLPHARKSPVRKARTTGSAETCREDATLVHLHVLHRHGVLPVAAEYVDELGCIGHAGGNCARFLSIWLKTRKKWLSLQENGRQYIGSTLKGIGDGRKRICNPENSQASVWSMRST